MELVKKQFLVVIMILMFTGCAKQEVRIIVEIQGQPDVNTLMYSVPISGTMFWGFVDTLKQSETGKFALNLQIDQSSFVTIFSEDDRFWSRNPQNRVKLFIEQGKQYHVSIDALKNVKISGANEKGQMLYATLPDPVYTELESRKWLYNNDTVPFISVHQQINDLKQADLSKFKELLDGKAITKSYFDLIQKDRDCYYASLEARLLIIKSYDNYRSRFGNKEDDLLNYLKAIYEQYPPNDESLLLSSYWAEYARLFVEEYNQFIHGNFDLQKLSELKKEGTYHTHIINESKKYLSGKMLEFFRASYIWYRCADYGSVDKDLISSFEQYKKDYPQSEYANYLKPYIDKIIDYHLIKEQPFGPAVLFMDNYSTINTLYEAIKPLLGKKIYIDVWASWCGPCKEEFEYNNALKEILAENDIQLLYISTDRDSDEQQWKNAIKFYRLNGIHIRANKELGNNLSQQHHLTAIPRYILIDEKGNIMEEHAKRPSQLVSGEKLW